MPFGQAGLMAVMGANLGKRIAFLTAEACGMTRREADLFSDKIAITAGQTLGTAASIVTLDPIGFGLTSAHTALLENDLARKRAGKG